MFLTGQTVGQQVQDFANEELDLKKVIDARQNGFSGMYILLNKSVIYFW